MGEQLENGPEDAVLIPVDHVAWQNDMYMAQGQQVCVGYDGVVRPFTIPLDVRRGWAARGQANPYSNRVETELLSRPDVCCVCGSDDPHVAVGWPVCPNDDFHEENRPHVSLWRRLMASVGAWG
jgi:hypothetical protein